MKKVKIIGSICLLLALGLAGTSRSICIQPCAASGDMMCPAPAEKAAAVEETENGPDNPGLSSIQLFIFQLK